MKYTVREFADAQPEWKKKRDAIVTRILYRPCSFLLATFCANVGISANSVSRFSLLLGIVTNIVFFMNVKIAGVIGSIMMFFWIIVDCTDGNLARTIKAEPYGEFLDAAGGYVMCGFLMNVLGYRAFFEESSIFYMNPLIIFVGAIAASSESISRLIYQKYVNASYELGIEGKVAHDGSNANLIDRIRVFADMNMGIGGFLPIFCLIGCLEDFLWLVVIIYALFYCCVLMGTICYLFIKTKKI